MSDNHMGEELRKLHNIYAQRFHEYLHGLKRRFIVMGSIIAALTMILGISIGERACASIIPGIEDERGKVPEFVCGPAVIVNDTEFPYDDYDREMLADGQAICVREMNLPCVELMMKYIDDDGNKAYSFICGQYSEVNDG